MFEIRQLSKSFKAKKNEVRALENLSFELDKGKATALLGPNGAGKSTAVKILISLLRPDSGAFNYQGRDLFKDPHQLRQLLGYVSQELALDKVMTGVEFLRFCAGLIHKRWRDVEAHALSLLEQLDLGKAKDRQIGTYSGGMKRRLDLAAALLHQPRLLVLDEPTNGLDLEARELIWSLVTGFLKQGGALLLVSHDFREIGELADQAVILKSGRVIRQGRVTALKKEMGSLIVRLKSAEVMNADQLNQIKAALGGWQDRLTWLPESEWAAFAYKPAGTMLSLQNEIDELLRQKELKMVSLNIQEPTIEDVYRSAMGGSYV